MSKLGRTYAVMGTLTFLLGLGAAARIVERSGAEPQETAKAKASTEAWLLLVDGARYGESWDQAAELFRKAVTRALWERQVEAARGPFGRLVSRKLDASQAATSLPGAPDGHYVVFTYSAEYAQKRAAVETVTAMQEQDGSWHVAGYFIR